jgi:hypothetical protein
MTEGADEDELSRCRLLRGLDPYQANPVEGQGRGAGDLTSQGTKAWALTL